jgi:manganese/iron transport system permease protein
LNALLEPLTFEFFVRAMIGVSLTAVLCGVVGCFVVLRALSYIGDAMAHAVFPGIVAAFLLRVNYFVGGSIAAILTALGIGWVTRAARIRQDAAVGTVFVGMFALGIVLLSRSRTSSLDLTHLLVGDPLGITVEDIWFTLALGGVMLGLLLALRKEFTLVAFDEIEARVSGLPVGFLNTLLLVLIALTVVLAIQMVGTVLVVSLLVTSSSTARLLTTRLSAMMMLSAIIGAVGGIVGLYLSYFLDAPNGATIVLVNTAIFLTVLIWKRSTNA